jgi:DNA-binding response OmpR family regulator
MPKTPTVLTVDINPRNQELLGQFLGKEGYALVPVRSLHEFDEALAEAKTVDLALVDITGFDRGIWERCEILRDRGVPLLVLSPRQSAALQQESLAHGARGVLVKPVGTRQLLGFIRGLMGEEEA